jgi:hypothetical protein
MPLVAPVVPADRSSLAKLLVIVIDESIVWLE